MLFFKYLFDKCMVIQKQPPIGVPKKRCSENMQQIYRRTAMPKCDFNKVAIEITLRHGCSLVNLLHIFRTLFPKNTSEYLHMRSCTLQFFIPFHTIIGSFFFSVSNQLYTLRSYPSPGC